MAYKRLTPVTLKELAATLSLSQSTVSRIVNGGADAHRISAETQQRVLHAAAQSGYTANTVAKSLRLKRSYMVGVLVPEISEGYATTVLSGIEDELLKDGYFYFVVSHHHRPALLEAYPHMMLSRAVEGIIAIDSVIEGSLPVPLVSISGHQRHPGSVNIELDHNQAARLALEHIKSLGHTRIAFIKGQEFSSDTNPRWQSIEKMARVLGISIDANLVVQLQGSEPGPQPGIAATQDLLKRNRSFSALLVFNDMTAVGAIQALREAGMRIPEEVSVVGFDDVLVAYASNPPLTTIHQPLRSMGQVAAKTLLELIRDTKTAPRPSMIKVFPKLVVRKSTAHPPACLSGSF